MTEKSITPEQEKQQIKRFVEDAVDRALEKAELDKDGLQRLIENGRAFQDKISVAIRKLSTFNEYADEEVASDFGYWSGYSKPRGITEQTNILRQLMPGIGFANEKLAEQPLPQHAEGWFAIPKWQLVAPTYGEAMQKVCDLLNKQRESGFDNYRKGRFGARYLRQHERTEKALSALGEEQKGSDILVVAAQFGLRHRGRSVRRARAVFAANEFGLGAFEIACMLLTHPERLRSYDDLSIDCPGDEYAPAVAGVWCYAPSFGFAVGTICLDTYSIGEAIKIYGAASGFAAQ